MNELTTGKPADDTMRTRLWDSDWTLVYDSDLPNAVAPDVAIRSLLDFHEQVNVTIEFARWNGRAMLNDANEVELVQEYEFPKKVMEWPNWML